MCDTDNTELSAGQHWGSSISYSALASVGPSTEHWAMSPMMEAMQVNLVRHRTGYRKVEVGPEGEMEDSQH